MLFYRDLKHNDISTIYGRTFLENKKLVFMVLSGNPLREIEETGLLGPTDLQFLYLDNTLLTKLPSKGISSLTLLDIKGTQNLISLPDPGKFEKLTEISVEYSMHCCAFRAVQSSLPKIKSKRPCPDIMPLEQPRPRRATANLSNIENGLDDIFQEIIDSFKDPAPEPENESDRCKILIDLENERLERLIKCSPEPDEFNPCEDVMGTHVLRAFSWFISIFAVIGNIFQLVILFSSRQELTVYKLLMYNLGFSNLLMGIYLMIMCCVDGYTYGEYYNFAQNWQYNGGCKTMGFIALFATQLSVCTLVLITIERFLLIIYALQVQNQMKLKHAMIGISISWLYSFIVALLPLTDTISSYTKVAICLPMSMKSPTSESYVVWLLLSYMVAFLLIVFCYIRMYINISDVRPGNSSQTIDIQVAKRMSMIIFSNFLCWLPISFAGIMAMYSKIEFNVGVGKFLLVFIFPLNACTNPFLYAIFTKVFRGDTLALLSSCGLFKVADKKYQRRNEERSRRNSSQTALHNFAHESIEPFRNTNNFDETNVGIPVESNCNESPLEVMIKSDFLCEKKIKKMKEVSDIYPIPKRNHIGIGFEKPRSESKRGLLLETEIKQCRDPRFRSESNDTCSTGISRSSVLETDEEFAKMIGSVHKTDCNKLLE